MSFKERAHNYNNPEDLAIEYLISYFGNDNYTFPINPFKMLKDEGILFSIRDFEALEGIYIPVEGDNDVPIVGINGNRPITRQRFTAAHELCHHFRDSDEPISCPIDGIKNKREIFADRFAAALLMPFYELRDQINFKKNSDGFVSFDSILEIAEFFGVSFEACVFRIAYTFHAVDGDTDSDALRERINGFKVEQKRKERGFSYVNLYTGLLDNYEEQLAFEPSERAELLFENQYIYNDSRMEGVNVTQEQASEIVSDLLLNKQNSKHCKETNEHFMSIAGHYKMYEHIFDLPSKQDVSVFDCFKLNNALFSYYPFPEYGGKTRDTNTLVLGAKFESIDHNEIFNELIKEDKIVKDLYDHSDNLSISEIIQKIADIHHRLTVIHPFMDGNGRSLRAFMNLQLVKMGLPPVYIKVDQKDDYINALAEADEGNLKPLYEVIYKAMLRCQMDLMKY